MEIAAGFLRCTKQGQTLLDPSMLQGTELWEYIKAYNRLSYPWKLRSERWSDLPVPLNPFYLWDRLKALQLVSTYFPVAVDRNSRCASGKVFLGLLFHGVQSAVVTGGDSHEGVPPWKGKMKKVPSQALIGKIWSFLGGQWPWIPWQHLSWAFFSIQYPLHH